MIKGSILSLNARKGPFISPNVRKGPFMTPDVMKGPFLTKGAQDWRIAASWARPGPSGRRASCDAGIFTGVTPA
jgi:hypothetical protein